MSWNSATMVQQMNGAACEWNAMWYKPNSKTTPLHYHCCSPCCCFDYCGIVLTDLTLTWRVGEGGSQPHPHVIMSKHVTVPIN